MGWGHVLSGGHVGPIESELAKRLVRVGPVWLWTPLRSMIGSHQGRRRSVRPVDADRLPDTLAMSTQSTVGYCLHTSRLVQYSLAGIVIPTPLQSLAAGTHILMDIIDREARSRLMGRIRGKNTKPEMAVRRIAHHLGFRFRLHRRDMPSSPDLVFPRLRKVVFVHGCYWHRHPGCRLAYEPKSNVEFWREKFAANVARDQKALEELRVQGWDTLVIWECEAKDSQFVTSRLLAYFGPSEDR